MIDILFFLVLLMNAMEYLTDDFSVWTFTSMDREGITPVQLPSCKCRVKSYNFHGNYERLTLD